LTGKCPVPAIALFFIDNLRIALIVLAVAYRAGQAYGFGG
jgi:hypothetical protein